MKLPSVLIPSLDLGVGEVELGRELLSVLDAQVLLLLEAPLQGLELVVGESCPGLALLPGVHLATAGSIFRRRCRVVV